MQGGVKESWYSGSKKGAASVLKANRQYSSLTDSLVLMSTSATSLSLAAAVAVAQRRTPPIRFERKHAIT